MVSGPGSTSLKWADNLKQSAEGRLSDELQAEAVVTAAMDEFFNKLASEVNRWEDSPD